MEIPLHLQRRLQTLAVVVVVGGFFVFDLFDLVIVVVVFVRVGIGNFSSLF